MLTDLRLALRLFLKSPGFTLIAIFLPSLGGEGVMSLDDTRRATSLNLLSMLNTV